MFVNQCKSSANQNHQDHNPQQSDFQHPIVCRLRNCLRHFFRTVGYPLDFRRLHLSAFWRLQQLFKITSSRAFGIIIRRLSRPVTRQNIRASFEKMLDASLGIFVVLNSIMQCRHAASVGDIDILGIVQHDRP